ncbi:replicative DNA helicase [Mycolicibacterium sphagni]|nr:DnaB-like helicase C-terminal domain-containing protein [Mycolicibacterium sphagni]
MPPHDLAAEQCVIGSLLMSQAALNTVATMLTVSDFYRPVHGEIFAAALALVAAGEPVDAMTVARELETRGQLAKIGGAPYLLTCIEVTPTAYNVSSYAQIVLDKAQLRRLSELGTRLKQLAYTEASTSDDVHALMSQGEKFFREQYEPDRASLTFDLLADSWEEWLASSESVIPTPWPSLNDSLNGGLRRGALYCIAARPGVGKSVAALQIAGHTSHWGFHSAVFSMEMSRDEVMSRRIADGAGVNFSHIMRKKLDLEERARIDRWLKENRTLPFEVNDRSRQTVEQIVSHARSMAKVDVLVVDYLQLMAATDKKASREQQVAHMSRELKIAAKELNVAIVACSQLNRGPLQGGKVRAPNIGDLRESGAIEQDCDVVLLLHNDEDDPGILQMIVGKNRNGRMGDLALSFEGHYQRIS